MRLSRYWRANTVTCVALGIIVLQVLVFVYAYASPTVAWGHRFYAMKRGVEDWQLRNAQDPAARAKTLARLAQRRIAEVRILVRSPKIPSSFGYLIELAQATESGDGNPVSETIEDAVAATEAAMEAVNAIAEAADAAAVISALAPVVAEEITALRDIAADVGAGDPEIVGGIAAGIRALEENATLLERAREVVEEAAEGALRAAPEFPIVLPDRDIPLTDAGSADGPPSGEAPSDGEREADGGAENASSPPVEETGERSPEEIAVNAGGTAPPALSPAETDAASADGQASDADVQETQRGSGSEMPGEDGGGVASAAVDDAPGRWVQRRQSPRAQQEEYAAVESRIRARQDTSRTLVDRLAAQGIPEADARAFAERIVILDVHAATAFSAGGIAAAARWVSAAEALEEEVGYFARLAREDLVIREVEGEIADAQEALQFLDGDLARARAVLVTLPWGADGTPLDGTLVARGIAAAQASLVRRDLASARSWVREAHDAAARISRALEATVAPDGTLRSRTMASAESIGAMSAEFSNLQYLGTLATNAGTPDTPWEAFDERFDGTDWEIVALRADGLPVAQLTDDLHDDRFPASPSTGAPKTFLVWQTTSSNGWEIVGMERGHTPFFLTVNRADDVAPVTDGRFIVWQGMVNERWQIVRADIQTGETVTLSTPGATAIEPAIADGSVTWKEWANEAWEARTIPLHP